MKPDYSALFLIFPCNLPVDTMGPSRTFVYKKEVTENGDGETA